MIMCIQLQNPNHKSKL
uniref:Uncharacterized protein n=1 Tax=Arundo donax TaxID=35708 RepID=A0A0A8ZHB7_ARUDO